MKTNCPSCSYSGKIYPQDILFTADRSRRIRCPQCKEMFMEDPDRTAVMPAERPASAPPKPVFRPEPAAKKTPVPREEPSAVSRVQPALSETPTDSAESQYRSFSFHGSGKSLFGISLVNGLLTLLTLGVYFSWGKAKARRYLYSQAEFNEERFSYHGTGKELFIGYLKGALVFGGLTGLMSVVAGIAPPAQILFPFIFFGLVAFALFGSMRYAMSRTAWRDIRFSFMGDLKEFVKLYAVGVLLTGLTLGLYLPYFRTGLRHYWTNHIQIGNSPFEYDGRGKDLFTSYLLAVLLLVPTLGLSLIWYLAKEQRYHWEHTRLAGGQFASTLTGSGMIGLTLVNLLLLVVTAGLAYPWVKVRNIRYKLDHLSVEGPMDLESIGASPQPDVSALGEGLTEIMDVGVSVG